MKIAYFPKQTALNSETVWRAFLDGIKMHNFSPSEDDMSADAAMIWSVLWQGRMRMNKSVYDHYVSQRKPVFIIEVGALKRGETWKISVNNITNQGIYPDRILLDPDRPKKLGISLQSENQNRKSEILLALQQQSSLQWYGQSRSVDWVNQKIQEIRKFSQRKIVIRPHPRDRIGNLQFDGAVLERPIKVVNTYDEFDLKFNYHCVINHNSGPGIQAAINGCPVICHESSLAYPVSNHISQIESLKIPDRSQWFINLCHTEWTVDEISQGIPQKILLEKLDF